MLLAISAARRSGRDHVVGRRPVRRRGRTGGIVLVLIGGVLVAAGGALLLS